MATTNTRQLRLLVNGVLALHNIDNLACEMHIVDAIKKFLEEGNAEPVRTKDKILADISRSLGKSAVIGDLKQSIVDEINKRTGLRPTGQDWEDFVLFCVRENEQGKTISKFLDWWMLDEWQAQHPPSRPQIWRVKWDLAFRGNNTAIASPDDVAV